MTSIAPPPPYSTEAEQGVLGSMLQQHGGSEAIAEAMAKIGPEHFYIPAHRTIFTAICDLHDAGQAIDLITFTQTLRDKNLLDAVGGPAFVTSLSTFVPCAANVTYYIDIVRDKYILREIIFAGTETVRRAYEESDEPETLLDAMQSRFDSVRSIHGRNGSDLPAIEDAAELISKPIDLPDDVIVGVLHRGAKMVLGGASKAFKTWTLVDLALSVVTETDWLGRFPTKRGRVLYINLELQGGFFAKRLRAVCEERQIKIEPEMLKVWNLRGCAADISKLLPRLLRRIGRDKYVLIIIDPIYKCLGERDENSAGDIATLLNEIEHLAVKTDAAVAFGAHFSKGNQAAKESIDRIGGSGVFARDPDSILNFTRHEQADCFTVDAVLRNHAPVEPFVVRWEYPLFNVDATLDPTRLQQAGREKQYHAKDVLAVIDGPMSATKIVKEAYEEFQIPRRRVFELLAELKKGGLIKQPEKRGPYEPV